MVSVQQRVQGVLYAMQRGLGQRRACALLRVSRSMVTYRHRQPLKDQPVRAVIDTLIDKHPAWGKRLIFTRMVALGHRYTECQVHRIYRQAGYAAQWRRRTRKIRRNARINPVAAQAHDVWCMDFAEDRLMSGRKMMALVVKDEATAFGLRIAVQRSFKGVDVERELDRLVETYGAPQYIRSDNGGQFIAHVVQNWATKRNITLAYIQPGKPWQNGSAESFVGTYRREVLNAEIFLSLEEAQVISDVWLDMYNHERPHSKHDYLPPASAFNKPAA